MQALGLLALVVLTSIAAVWIGARRGLPRRALPAALDWTLECLGLALLFLAANLLLGALAVLALRTLTSGFVGIYVLDDLTLAILSGLQGVLVRAWMDARR